MKLYYMPRRISLIVTDGWGIAKPGPKNFVLQAKTPNFNNFLKKYPHTSLKASGNAVGLPNRTQGNSEVGHLHLGAGRIVWQMYEKINREIRNKNLFKDRELLNAMKFAKEHKTSLHLMGLCSDAGVHAHTDHLIALLEIAKNENLKNVFIHFFADGRDVPEKYAKKYVKIIENAEKKIGVGIIATMVGRYYSMDRDKNWKRTKRAYDMLVMGKGFRVKNAEEGIEKAYERGDKTDYYIQPTVITDKNGKPLTTIKDGDSVIFFNFRTDRPRQLTEVFISKNFKKFKRELWPKVFYTTMTEYDKRFDCPFAFEEETVKNNLGEMISKKGLKQLRIAETEKYAHVTYFFNSQVEKPYKGEEMIMLPSPKVPSYDLKPEMSAYEITKEVVRQISKKKYDFILINFANCDLVGHSAVKKAIIKCVEVVDECIGRVVESCLRNDYIAIITADHGSAEDKLYPDGKPKPAHSTNPVNFIIVSNDEKLKKIKLSKGELKDVAPTILDLMNIKKTKEMRGKSLIVK